MKLLVIGGSGRVGTGVLPFLAEKHEITVYDVRPPQVDSVEYIEGSVLDVPALEQAMGDAEGLIYMAMNAEFDDPDDGYDINVRGVHKTFQAALNVGMKHIVHTSTGSIMDETSDHFADDHPLHACHFYGLSKGMGEMVCEFFARMHGLSVIALRLCAPSSEERWKEQCKPDRPNMYTTHRDTARAYDIALGMTDHQGFDAALISGDHEWTMVDCSRAKELLGWVPLDICP
jgi:nucleoside-diphosphate-sugar epimerase